jgi:alpha-glucosidase (family GH31 glycosyl hydrolase)
MGITRWVVLAASIAACGGSPDPCPHGSFAPLLTISNASMTVDVTTDPYGFVVHDATGAPVLSSAGAGSGDGYGAIGWTTGNVVIKRFADPGYAQFESSLDPWRDHLQVVNATSTSTEIDVTLESDEGCVTISHVLRDGALRVSATLDHSQATPRAWEVAFQTPSDEAFLGMGERYDAVDHRGLSLYNWQEEGGLTSGEADPPGPTNPFPNGGTMTYYPVPFFLSTSGYAFWLDTTWRSQFDLASDRPDAWRAWHIGPSLAFEVYVGSPADTRPWPLQAIDTFTATTGRPMIPPDWSFGPRRRINRGAMIGAVSEIQAMRDNDLALTSVDDTLHFLPEGDDLGNEQALMDWTSANAALGYKVIGYYNPYFSNDPAAPNAADTAYGVAHGYFLLDATGVPGVVALISGTTLSVFTVDVTNAAAVAWFGMQFKRAFDLGYSGWMYDFGEYVQANWTASDGETGYQLHDQFPVLYDKAAHDALEALRPGDWYYFARSGYTGSQQYAPMTWSGDPDASFGQAEGLPAQVRATITLSMAGVAHVGSDIGGFKCQHNDANTANGELLARWIEAGSMSSDMHDEDSCSGGGTKATIWSAPEAQTAWKTYARLHTRLAPYMQALAAQAHQTGTPLVMSPWLLHPDERALAPVGDAFYFGPGLFAAPVVARGDTTKTVMLPPGLFVDMRDGTLYTGGAAATLPAPVTELPLLLVDGQLVPLLDPTIDTLAPETNPTVVGPADVANVYDVAGVISAASGQAHFTLADGSTLDATYAGGLATCTGCTITQVSARVQRIQVTGSDVTAGGLHLTESGVTRALSWDLYVID